MQPNTEDKMRSDGETDVLFMERAKSRRVNIKSGRQF